VWKADKRIRVNIAYSSNNWIIKEIYINLFTWDKYVDIFLPYFLSAQLHKTASYFRLACFINFFLTSLLSARGRDWHRLEKAAYFLFQSWSYLFKHPTLLFNLQQCVLLRCRLRGGKASWFFIGPSFNVFSGNYCNTSCGNVNTDRSSLVLHKSIVHEYKYHDSFSLVLNIQMMLGKAYCCSVDSEAVCFLSCSLW